MRLHHVDHGSIGGIFVIAHIGNDFIIQVINHIHGRIVDVVHHVHLVLAIHDVGHCKLRVVVDGGGDLLAVVLFVLVAEVMVGQHRHVVRPIGDVLHHGQFRVFFR